jgi:hypothetical protein
MSSSAGVEAIKMAGGIAMVDVMNGRSPKNWRLDEMTDYYVPVSSSHSQ